MIYVISDMFSYNLYTICQAHVFVICYSVVDRTSFNNVAERWLPAAITCSSRSPIFLIGTVTSDLHQSFYSKKA